MLAALHQRNFAFLWFGQVISLIGDWVLFVVFPFYVLFTHRFGTGYRHHVHCSNHS